MKRKNDDKVQSVKKKHKKEEGAIGLIETQIGQPNYGSYIVKTIFELMGDEKTWNSTLKLFGVCNIDNFGTITKEKIDKGSEILKELYISIKTESGEQIQRLSQQFYSLIPHLSEPLLNTVKILNDKISLLSTLYSILLVHTHKVNATKLRQNFVKPLIESLKLNFCPLAKGDLYKSIELYLKNTDKSRRFEVLEIVVIRPKAEKPPLSMMKRKQIQNKEKVIEEVPWGGVEGERKLLWYGLYPSSAYAFLTHPFSLHDDTSIPAPFELPLGPGFYLSDIFTTFSYSAGYDSDGVGIAFLVETALGTVYEVTSPDYLRFKPENVHSVKAGGVITVLSNSQMMEQMAIPTGTLIRSGIKSEFTTPQYAVERKEQLKLRYMVKVRFSLDWNTDEPFIGESPVQ